jgi:iron complex transport system ATP-binding protein
MAEPTLTLDRLAVEFAGRRRLDGVSLTLQVGEAAALIGANGAGKTTLLRAIAGLVPAATGGLEATGLDPRTAPAAASARRRLYFPQQPGCAWDPTVAELGEISGRPDAWRGWAGRLELDALTDRLLSTLSGGERKAAHLALALATLGEPYGALILLDEPTASLDRRRQDAVRAIVLELTLAGAACLVATHDAAWAAGFPRVVALSEGRAVADGRPADVLTPDVGRAVWGGP